MIKHIVVLHLVEVKHMQKSIPKVNSTLHNVKQTLCKLILVLKSSKFL